MKSTTFSGYISLAIGVTLTVILQTTETAVLPEQQAQNLSTHFEDDSTSQPIQLSSSTHYEASATPDQQVTTHYEASATPDQQVTTHYEASATPDQQVTTHYEASATPDQQVTKHYEASATPDQQPSTDSQTIKTTTTDSWQIIYNYHVNHTGNIGNLGIGTIEPDAWFRDIYPTLVTTAPPPEYSHNSHGSTMTKLDVGGVMGIAFGVIFVVVAAICVCLCCYSCRKQQQYNTMSTAESPSPTPSPSSSPDFSQTRTIPMNDGSGRFILTTTTSRSGVMRTRRFIVTNRRRMRQPQPMRGSVMTEMPTPPAYDTVVDADNPPEYRQTADVSTVTGVDNPLYAPHQQQGDRPPSYSEAMIMQSP